MPAIHPTVTYENAGSPFTQKQDWLINSYITNQNNQFMHTVNDIQAELEIRSEDNIPFRELTRCNNICNLMFGKSYTEIDFLQFAEFYGKYVNVNNALDRKEVDSFKENIRFRIKQGLY